ncbi:MAG TPA: sulfite exporter TauE/SafE family protein [Terracidiphilus sp.]|jgi:hypothetical protein|nr:sulfite exporter TauE/SafE family protein [Terracidiphilus sp.]
MTHLSALPTTWQWIWLFVAAFLAGVLNAVAGGGSLLLFPAMLGMNLPPVEANATNTVAIWTGQLTSVAAYRKNVRKNLRLAWPMALAGLIGGAAGAMALLRTSQTTFLHLVPWLMLFAASIFAVSGPVSRWVARRTAARQAGHPGQSHGPHPVAVFAVTIVLAFYGGYFGAGVGFLLMTMLALFGYQDINEINALKVVANTAANGTAFVVFVIDGQVAWRYCLVAMVTCAIGGYSCARVAHRIPQALLRGIVVVIGLTMAAWFFWKQ